MSTESMDRRVRKTRRQLRECLISLLKEKKVQDILRVPRPTAEAKSIFENIYCSTFCHSPLKPESEQARIWQNLYVSI